MSENNSEVVATERPVSRTESSPRKRQRNLYIPELQILAWNSQDVEASLVAMYQYAEKKAEEAITWYMRKKGSKALLSRGLRLAAILLTTLGGLIPIINSGLVPLGVSVGWLGQGDNLWIGQLGYLFLGFAAACVGLDKFFGFSSAWMRFITTALVLEKALSEFRIDWAMMKAKLGGRSPTPDQVQLMLQRIKDFVLVIDGEVEKETKEWIAEFRSNLADLEQTAKTQVEAARAGAIDVTVTNGMEAKDGFTVSLDGMTISTVRGTKYQIGYVPPGPHKVAVTGTVDGKSLDASELVNVPAGEIAKVTLALPVEEAQP